MSSDEEYECTSSDEIEMSSEDEYEYASIKPSDIIKENNEQRIQRLIDYKQKNRDENIFNIKKNIDENINYSIKEVNCKDIHDVLQTIFNKHINELYRTLANKDKWDDNIREFITYHENMNIDIDTSWLSTPEIAEIQEQGFQFFTGDKCANVDEDEFDGPNDLSIEEWENVDEIILYYYSTDDIFV